MKSSRQTTLRSHVTVTGIGVHSGVAATVTIGPADINAGFVFIRTGDDREIVASTSSVVATDFATVLGDHEGPLVSTAEHVRRAARYGRRQRHHRSRWTEIRSWTAVQLRSSMRSIKPVSCSRMRRAGSLKFLPIQITLGDLFGELRPYAGGFRAELEIEFANTPIGRQAYAFDLNADSFRRDICRARTFGRMGDVNKLWSAGYALGASLENSVVVDETCVLNTEGLRYADECVRHKVRWWAIWRSPGCRDRSLSFGARWPQAQPRRVDGAVR
jgi:UDP-3-O-[3-hydroxymyristoyl] N-acetylglucosamine deacetylase